tara:strand:+ start:284 stop:616 length:333 start_codon:yes stop_codon:yes gene_type:complete
MSKVQIHDALTGKSIIRDATVDEQKEIDDRNAIDHRLDTIRQIRKEHLEATDWWVLRGNMTDAQTQYRQKLRDIPADYDSSKYNELLARETDETKKNFGKLTHSVWTKPS